MIGLFANEKHAITNEIDVKKIEQIIDKIKYINDNLCHYVIKLYYEYSDIISENNVKDINEELKHKYKNNIIEANYLYSDNFILMRRIIELIYIYIISENIGFIRYVNNKILSVLSFTCIVSLVIINFVGKYIIEYYNYKTYDLVIIVSGMIFLQISIFYIVNSISKIVEEKLVLEIDLKSKQNDEDIIRMHKEMIGWRHDMRNHVNTVLGLIERNASNEAIEYIKEVDKRTSDFEKIRYTDNVALDSILTSKINLAKEKGINVKLELNISCEIKLTNIEICTLLGNLLDNSIEACEKLEKDKIIDLKMLAQEDKLIIKIKNKIYVNLIIISSSDHFDCCFFFVEI